MLLNATTEPLVREPYDSYARKFKLIRTVNINCSLNNPLHLDADATKLLHNMS